MTEENKCEQNKGKASFGDRMADILNFGALNLAMGVGYRLGLFDAMDSMTEPKTLGEIAEAAGLNKRYVAEWLGVMVCGDVVELGSSNGEAVYFLPQEHGDLLAARAGNSCLGVYTQEIPLLTLCAMEPVVAGFRNGGGVAYENYPRFQEFMSQLADAKHESVLVDVFLPSVDSGALVESLKSGIRVCDLGCGQGVAPLLMAQAFPKSFFVGLDLDEKAIEKANSMAVEKGLENIEFIVQDAAAVESSPSLEASFDWICAFDSIHDQTQPLSAMKGALRMLKPGGSFSMVDIAAETDLEGNRDHPMGAFLYTVSLMHCMPVGLVNQGRGLGMMWGRQKAVEMLKEAGFASVKVEEIPEDSFNLHFFCKAE